jgi:hypothetical protein
MMNAARSSGSRFSFTRRRTLALLRAVHRLPKIAAPLHVEPEIRAVAEHTDEDERRCGCHAAPTVAKLVHMLALHAHGCGERGLRQLHGLHEFLNQDFADAGRLALGHEHVRFTYSCDRPDMAALANLCQRLRRQSFAACQRGGFLDLLDAQATALDPQREVALDHYPFPDS